MIRWENTKSALQSLESLLTCKICKRLISAPCSLEACDHYFCRHCVENVVGVTSKCPECGTFAWMKDLKRNRQLNNLVSLCRSIRNAIESGSDSAENSVASSVEFKQQETCNSTSKQHNDFNIQQYVTGQSSLANKDLEKDQRTPGCRTAVSSHPNYCKESDQNILDLSVQHSGIEPSCSSGRSHHHRDSTSFESLYTDLKHDYQIESHLSGDKGSCKDSVLSIKKEREVLKRKLTECEEDDIKISKEIVERMSDPGLNTEQEIENDLSDDNGSCKENILTLKKERGALKRKLTEREQDDTRSTEILDTCSMVEPELCSAESKNINVKSKKLKEANANELGNNRDHRCMVTPTRKRSLTGLLSGNVKGSTISPCNKLFHSPTMSLSPVQLEKKNKRGESILHVASIKGSIEDVEWLLEKGANPNTRDNAGWSPLHEACNHGHTAIAKMLLDYGAIVDLPGGMDHDTPLHDAVANGRLEAAKLLVEHGAPLTPRNKQGMTPMDFAITEVMRNALKSSESSKYVTSPATQRQVKCVDFHQQEMPKVILCSGLNMKQKKMLEDCTRSLGGKVVKEFSTDVTHLVTTTNDTGHCARTIKYLSAILCGKWIVSFSWITKCLHVKSWVDECQYEIKGTTKGKTDVPRYSRINSEKQLPSLFDGCQFYFHGVFDPLTPSKDILIQLAKYGGGEVLMREPRTDMDAMPFLLVKDKKRKCLANLPVVAYHANPDSVQYRCTSYIIYDHLSHSKPTHKYGQISIVPVTWFLDCISNFEILDSQYF